MSVYKYTDYPLSINGVQFKDYCHGDITLTERLNNLYKQEEQQMLTYSPRKKTVTFDDGTEIDFYCGDSLNPVAQVLVHMHNGEVSLQDGYNNIVHKLINPLLSIMDD